MSNGTRITIDTPSVGNHTVAIWSDALSPNGERRLRWSIGLSNEVYVAVDGNLYEGRGIPPNIEVTAQTAGSFHERMRLDIQDAGL